ncbi:caspase family protein [Saccharopolyspora shandongensis]|uniref:caspase family protein n=1 Tax=Saccharopolyspora shandongensis TaxID=418495 RepID=UPI0033DBD74C
MHQALLVATTLYASDSLQPLQSPTKDAQALQDVLSREEVGGFDSVTALVNESRSTLMRAIEDCFRAAQSDDLVLLSISGHSAKDADDALYFLAADSHEVALDRTAVECDFVLHHAARSRCKAVMIILDCAHAGAFTLPSRENMTIIGASSAHGAAYDDPSFTQMIVEGLSTGDADLDWDGLISARELYQYGTSSPTRRFASRPPSSEHAAGLRRP